MDQQHKDKFEQIWDNGNYRQGSTALRMVPLIMSTIPAGSTINDYGCGTGRAEVELMRKSSYYINMIDIAENAIEAEALEILQRKDSPLKFYNADLCDLSQVPFAEWGICINTLMTVQADRLDVILSEIRRTCKNLIVEAYDMDDHRLVWQMTTVKMNAAGWMDTLCQYWRIVEFIQSKEHARRYIFVCREPKQDEGIKNET